MLKRARIPADRLGRGLVAVLMALTVGCAAPGTDTGDAARAATRIVVVTHGQSADPFWSVVSNGVHDAARDLGIRVEYQAPTSFDMVAMAQLIEAAIAARPSGLIVSIPDAAALSGALRAAVAAGVPVLSINSGDEAYDALGLLAHIGQTEYEAAFAGGERLAAAGATSVLCVNHEVGNLALDVRCRGLDDALRAAGGSTHVLAVDLGDPNDAQQRVANALNTDASLDGVLALGPPGATVTLAALRSVARRNDIVFGTFDLEAGVLRALANGEMLFAIDQQPYLQGYLGVILLTKYLETGALPGGGQIVRTGPGFVTQQNAEAVIRLTELGVR